LLSGPLLASPRSATELDEVLPARLHSLLFFFNDTATTEIYTLSLHDALPIWEGVGQCPRSDRQGTVAKREGRGGGEGRGRAAWQSEHQFRYGADGEGRAGE